MNYRRYDKALDIVAPSDVLNVRRDLSGPDVSQPGLSPTQPSSNFPTPFRQFLGNYAATVGSFHQWEPHQEVLSGFRACSKGVDPEVV